MPDLPTGRREFSTARRDTRWQAHADIVAGGPAGDPGHPGHGCARVLAGRPRLTGARVVGTGVGGERSTDHAARWAREVLAQGPTWCPC